MFSTSTKLLCIRHLLRACLIIFLLLPEGHAQVLQPGRLEIPVPPGEGQFEVVNGLKGGLFLYRQYSGQQEDAVQLIKVDTAFEQIFNGFIYVEKNYLIVGKKAFNNKLYLLFRYKDFSRNNFLLYVVDEKGNYSAQTIKGFIRISPTEFQITEKAVLIGGYYNHVPLVLHFSLATNQSKVVPGIFNESGELTQIKTYEDGSFDVLISAFNYQRQRTLWIKSYDSDGNLNTNFALQSENNKHLIFGRSITTADNTKLIAGVYGSRSAEFSHGIFIASIDPQGLQQMRYYQFADLENFFKYMKARREQRVKNRIERRKIKGKKIRLNYRFLVHEIVPYKDQYVLLGEAFYPRYISTDQSYRGFFNPGFYNPGMVQNGRIFDGYYYTHAVVMGFNPMGKVLWDNSFEINDVRTFTLEQFVKLEVQNDKIALLYLFDNALRTKIIQNNQVLEGKVADPIKTKFQSDVIKNTIASNSKLEYWYNDYLYAYGTQVLENQNSGSKRRVFFINKVRHAR
jgi:hypothetical protein